MQKAVRFLILTNDSVGDRVLIDKKTKLPVVQILTNIPRQGGMWECPSCSRTNSSGRPGIVTHVSLAKAHRNLVEILKSRGKIKVSSEGLFYGFLPCQQNSFMWFDYSGSTFWPQMDDPGSRAKMGVFFDEILFKNLETRQREFLRKLIGPQHFIAKEQVVKRFQPSQLPLPVRTTKVATDNSDLNSDESRQGEGYVIPDYEDMWLDEDEIGSDGESECGSARPVTDEVKSKSKRKHMEGDHEMKTNTSLRGSERDVEIDRGEESKCWFKGCHKTNVSTCGRCRVALYCSKEHQRQCFTTHRAICQRLGDATSYNESQILRQFFIDILPNEKIGGLSRGQAAKRLTDIHFTLGKLVRLADLKVDDQIRRVWKATDLHFALDQHELVLKALVDLKLKG